MASGGMRHMIPTIARTAVAVGIDGIFMEVIAEDLLVENGVYYPVEQW